MDKFTDVMIKFGAAVGENRYMSAIKTAFTEFMPFTIIGALAVMWSNIIVNDSTGLGALWAPIMKLSFLNPAFDAINFVTIGCIALFITFLIGRALSERYHLNGGIGACVAVGGMILASGTVQTVFSEAGDAMTVKGIFSSALGSQGLFAGMIMAIISVELYRFLMKQDSLKIKLPDQVPPQIAQSFEVLIPAGIALIIISVVSNLIYSLSGLYLNDLLFKFIQTPLTNVGGSLPGILAFQIVSSLLWCVGIHGDNVTQGLRNPIKQALTIENMEAVAAGGVPTNIYTNGFERAFMGIGGTGMILGLTIAILIVSKRQENRSIAKMAFIPNLFNIGEINFFGLPLVLNPFLIIPFIIVPIVSYTIGYLATAAGLCPIFYLDVPWTMPGIIIGFISSGLKVSSIFWQALVIVLSVLIYMPFVKMWEKALDKEEQERLAKETSAE